MTETSPAPNPVPAAPSRRPLASESLAASEPSGTADGDWKSPALPDLRSSPLDRAEVEHLLRASPGAGTEALAEGRSKAGGSGPSSNHVCNGPVCRGNA